MNINDLYHNHVLEVKLSKVKDILNKLTLEKSKILADQIVNIGIVDEVTLEGIVKEIFDKALDEPNFGSLYAELCKNISDELPKIQSWMIDKKSESRNNLFRKLLLNKCQLEFEKEVRWTEENKISKPVAEMTDEEKNEWAAKETERIKVKRRSLGNIKFIGELFKLSMLSEKIMHQCVGKLLFSNLDNPEEEDLEKLCNLMKTIGKKLDNNEKAQKHMNLYFEKIEELSKRKSIPSRIRFMLQDVYELRKDRWKSRTVTQGPKTIAQIHQDAEKEKKDMEKLRNSGRSGSGHNGMKNDYRRQSQDGWNTPKPRSRNAKSKILADQIVNIGIVDEVTLEGIVKEIFDKALDEPNFGSLYAELCKNISDELPKIQSWMIDKKSESRNNLFRKLLLNKCQLEFEKEVRWTEENKISKPVAEMTDEEKNEWAAKETERIKVKRRSLGNIKFIGELFKLSMLSEKIMHQCVGKLLFSNLDNPEEEDLEKLCNLMKTIGKKLDNNEKAQKHMNLYFEKIEELSKRKSIPSRIRFMLQDVYELRKDRWKSRTVTQGPKTIAQIHQDAEKEKKDMEKLRNSGRSGSGHNGMKNDYRRQSQDGWNTPKPRSRNAKSKILADQIVNIGIVDEVTLEGIVKEIFDKALDEPNFGSLYAELCKNISDELPKIQSWMIDKKSESRNNLFRKLLLNKCQLEFEKEVRWTEENKISKPVAEMTDEEKNEWAAKETERIKVKRRSLGNIKFIGELFKLSMLSEKIMHQCVGKLLFSNLDNPEEEDLEKLCNLMKTIGKKLDNNEKAQKHMNLYFEKIEELSKRKSIPSRIRFMLQDVYELRKDRWKSRTVTQGPKTIAQIHQDAEKEKKDMEKLRNSGRSGSGHNGMKNDYRRQSQDGWNTPKPRSRNAKSKILADQIVNIGIVDEVTLEGIVKEIFDKALDEPNFGSLYAELCKNISDELPKIQSWMIDKKSESRNNLFRKLLLNKCQLEFEKEVRWTEENKISKPVAEMTDEEKNEWAAKETERIKVKRRSLGNIKFIGELFKLSMLSEKIMHQCVGKLLFSNLDNPEEEDLEKLCNLMKTIGKKLDNNEKAQKHMNLYFEKIEELSKRKSIPSRIRFMLQDVYELRKDRWKSRTVTQGPKTIAQIHQDAEKEKKDMEKLRNSGRSGSGHNGMKNDYRRQSQDGWNTPKPRSRNADVLSHFGKINPISSGSNNILLGPPKRGLGGFGWQNKKSDFSSDMRKSGSGFSQKSSMSNSPVSQSPSFTSKNIFSTLNDESTD